MAEFIEDSGQLESNTIGVFRSADGAKGTGGLRRRFPRRHEKNRTFGTGHRSLPHLEPSSHSVCDPAGI